MKRVGERGQKEANRVIIYIYMYGVLYAGDAMKWMLFLMLHKI